jgi:hypothetical protein
MSGRLQAALVVALVTLVSSQSGGQDLQYPPGVLLLSRIKRHVARELEHLPEYTCLETVDRSLSHGDSKGKPGKLEPLDTLRLEILYSGRKELYASPGAHVFRDESPAAFIAGGMIGDGVFATQLQTIFVSETALFNFRGDDTVARDHGWGRAVKYDFRVPVNLSGWNIHLLHASGVIGEKGSFWADPETLELLRIEVHADEVPPGLPLADVILTSDYARMRIGTEDIMLPQAAELRLLELNGREYLDLFEYTHCHAYQAQSSISFNEVDLASPKPAPEPAAPGPASLPGISGNLPAGLQVPITLTTAVDNNSTVGTMLEGQVSANVDFKGKTVIPKGAPVHGRVRRLERYRDAGEYYVVGLEFTEVEAGGSLWRFYADLKSASGAPVEWLMSTGGSRAIANGYQSHTETIRLPDLPGVGSFFVRGARFALPVGFRMEWKTRALAQ